MRKHCQTYISLAALAFLLAVTLLMTSCASVWNWLWERDREEEVASEDLLLGGKLPDDEEDYVFEGAVSFDGGVHSGSDIYYVGEAGSPNRRRIIVIDAGHQLKGSSELEPNGPGSAVMKEEVSWGATGVSTGQTEYELNLAVALQLRNELIRRGYSVVMVRETNNVHISNIERAEIANKYSAAAYVRIHANSWTDETMRGAMTICHSAANPYPDCAAHYKTSRLLSELILEEFCEQTGLHRQNVREMDNMTGTNWSRVPTTIVEMGFLSNPSDDEHMASEYFRREAALGIANGLDRYFAALEELESETAPDTETGDSAQILPPAASRPASPESVTEQPTDTPANEPGDTVPDTPNETPDEAPPPPDNDAALTEPEETEASSELPQS